MKSTLIQRSEGNLEFTKQGFSLGNFKFHKTLGHVGGTRLAVLTLLFPITCRVFIHGVFRVSTLDVHPLTWD